MKYNWIAGVFFFALTTSCTKTDNGEVSEAKLIFKFRFDSTLQRLDNSGQSAPVTVGNGAQSPVVNSISVHYIELCANENTLLGQGRILFRGIETSAGSEKAIDYDKAAFFKNHEVFFAVPLRDIPAGEYEWFRMEPDGVNLSVVCHIDTTIVMTTDTSSQSIVISRDQPGTLVSFLGYNTYLNALQLNNQFLLINDNRKQGYWAFETILNGDGFSQIFSDSAQLPAGNTTVVNPIFNTSPVPEGSGVITAAFTPGKLIITGRETQNIIVEVALSVNHSFEWKEVIGNGEWDPLQGEPIVDMGIRGMIPLIK